MSISGEPTPACLAKQLFAQHVRYGDWIRFPRQPLEAPDVDAIVAWNDKGRRSGVFVNTTAKPRVLTVADWDDGLGGCGEVLRVDIEHRQPGGARAVRRNRPPAGIRRRRGDQRATDTEVN